jgi:hypothetical protein
LFSKAGQMEIIYRTKAESKKMQEDEFLKLPPVERFYAFLELSYALKDLPVKNKQDNSDNFLIVIDSDRCLE